MLEVKNLHVSVEDTPILHGVNLTVKPGEIHVIMGPNGSGKSTFANSLMGHPKYSVTDGIITVDGEDVTEEDPNVRAKAGLFLSMQYPPEIAGVTMTNFLRKAKEALTETPQRPAPFYKELLETIETLKLDPTTTQRYVNQGFSGGEKKKAEMLQMRVLDPAYAILDETDSGLDVDALRIVADGINDFASDGKGIVLITHYERFLKYVTPTHIHIMIGGQFVHEGGKELAAEIEAEGYKKYE